MPSTWDRGRAALAISVASMIAASAARSFRPCSSSCRQISADLGQQIVVDALLDQCVAEPAMGGLVRHARVQIQPREQHEIQPHLQAFLKLGIRQTAPTDRATGPAAGT